MVTMSLLPNKWDKKSVAKWRKEQRKKINRPSTVNVETIRNDYARRGLKPRWVDYYRTKHRMLAVQTKEFYEGLGFAIRIVERKEGGKFDKWKGDKKPTYSVQLYDSESPLVSHTFQKEYLPKELQPKFPKKSLRKRLLKLLPV